MNVGTVSYGTGRVRAIGSLSEAVIVDFYGTGDLQPEKRLMLAVCNMRLNALRNMPNTIVSLKKPKNGCLKTIMNGLFLSSTSAMRWIWTRGICDKVSCIGDKARSRSQLHSGQRLSSIKVRINAVLKHLFNSPVKEAYQSCCAKFHKIWRFGDFVVEVKIPFGGVMFS
jgi:hypothetical protein